MARRRRNPEIIAGRIAGDGSVLAGDGFTSRLISAGLYELAFPSSFRLVGFTATAALNGRACSYQYQAANVTQVSHWLTSTFAVESNPWSFVAVGVQQ